jgi:Zn-dependent protease
MLDFKTTSAENPIRILVGGDRMLFMEPSQTPYDLRWRMFGVPVRVHPMFWLVSVIMGWNTVHEGFQYLLIWVACSFASILIHEFGHVAMGQIFGSRGHIVLYGFGGLAIGSNQLDQRWQRIAVCFAGPLAGFLLLGIMFVLLWIWDPEAFPAYLAMAKMDLGLSPGDVGELRRLLRAHSHMVNMTVQFLIFINLMWGLVNLLPIWPLDGGQISRDICEGVWPSQGLPRSLGISMMVAGLLAAHCLLVVIGLRLLPLEFGSVYTAILFAILAIQSFQLMQQVQSHNQWREDHWED